MELLRRLGELRGYGQPILFASSRKSSIGSILGGLPPEERVEATVATTALAINNGADIVRVHDVLQNARAAKIADKMRGV
ncbi:MAG: dihydropteroate synthase, partial [bacterium]